MEEKATRVRFTVKGALSPSTGHQEVLAQAEMEVDSHTTCLELLETLSQDEEEDGLLYRHSCHHGSCGTCACRINGREGLACTTRVADLGTTTVTVEPLRKLPVRGGLVADPSVAFSSLPLGSTYRRHSETNAQVPPPEEVGAWNRFEDCIECGCCVSACPVTEAFVGPASLALARRDLENAPQRAVLVKDWVSRPDGVAACKRAFACSRVCPTGVAPGRKIEELRRILDDRQPGDGGNP